MKSSILFSLFLSVLSVGFTACTEADKEDQTSTEENGEISTADEDGDGQSPADGDCDDGDASIYAGAEDASIDGTDQNCDGVDGTDADQDGFVDINGGGDDCDDADPTLTPMDADQDGFSTCTGDCDDADAFAFPGSAELEVSLNVVPIVGDDQTTCSLMGYRPLTEEECLDYAKDMGLFFEQAEGSASGASGCVELGSAGTIEYLTNTQEQACDSGFTCYCMEETLGCMSDEDGDGYGDSTPANASVQPGTDCDDTEPTVNPDGEDEGVDGLDQNCDGVDEAECENDDSFMDFLGQSAPFVSADLSAVTGCDNIFTEVDWMGCHTPLYWLSYEWSAPLYGQGEDPTGTVLADYCECQCPDRGQQSPHCVTLTLTDSGGDGWNGGSLNFDLATYTLESGSETSFEVCQFEIDGCTTVKYSAGQNPEENGWTISYGDYVVGTSDGGEFQKLGEGCVPFPSDCENCQSLGPDRFYCGEGNYGGMFGGCASTLNGVAECYDGSDEVPGARYTCLPYNYIPPE